jgi:hypothetical protein
MRQGGGTGRCRGAVPDSSARSARKAAIVGFSRGSYRALACPRPGSRSRRAPVMPDEVARSNSGGTMRSRVPMNGTGGFAWPGARVEANDPEAGSLPQAGLRMMSGLGAMRGGLSEVGCGPLFLSVLLLPCVS